MRLPGRPLERLAARSVESLTRLACIVALVGLAVMAASIIHPGPLLVIFATSVGHAIGGFAVLCYLLAVVMDVKRVSHGSAAPPQPQPPQPPDANSAEANDRT